MTRRSQFNTDNQSSQPAAYAQSKSDTRKLATFRDNRNPAQGFAVLQKSDSDDDEDAAMIGNDKVKVEEWKEAVTKADRLCEEGSAIKVHTDWGRTDDALLTARNAGAATLGGLLTAAHIPGGAAVYKGLRSEKPDMAVEEKSDTGFFSKLSSVFSSAKKKASSLLHNPKDEVVHAAKSFAGAAKADAGSAKAAISGSQQEDKRVSLGERLRRAESVVLELQKIIPALSTRFGALSEKSQSEHKGTHDKTIEKLQTLARDMSEVQHKLRDERKSSGSALQEAGETTGLLNDDEG